jgi:hypothetical protein
MDELALDWNMQLQLNPMQPDYRVNAARIRQESYRWLTRKTTVQSTKETCVWLQSVRRPLSPAIILAKGHCPSRGVHSFLRAVRVFLSGAVNCSAFQEVSLGREVSLVFTSNGPLIYRWEANHGEQRETAGRLSLSIKLGGSLWSLRRVEKGVSS